MWALEAEARRAREAEFGWHNAALLATERQLRAEKERAAFARDRSTLVPRALLRQVAALIERVYHADVTDDCLSDAEMEELAALRGDIAALLGEGK